jgi:hypothetical protein
MTHATPSGPPVVAIVADERPAGAALEVRLASGAPATLASSVSSTQVANPRRTTLRAAFQLVVAIAIALPQIIPIILGAWSPEWLVTTLAQVLLVQTALTRIMALPGVDGWLQVNLPGLASLRTEQRRLE